VTEPPVELGGDPACWIGVVEDRRDGPPPDGAPAPRPDLADPTQVHHLVVAFYREVVFDEVLEPVFGEVAEVDWAEHIPKLIDYWCWILFGTGGPTGAVTGTHAHLHGLRPIEPVHCDRWFALWVASVDGRWRGPRAEHAKRHAATLMAGLARHVFGFTWTPAGAARPGP
jgi:hemoglobin